MNNTTIVIPVYLIDKDMADYAKYCMRSVRENTPEAEIIVVDNRGPVESKIVYQFADAVIVNKENVGYGPAINQGFRLAKKEYLCAMNDDVFVKEGWLEPLLKVLKHPHCGVVRPRDYQEAGDGIKEDYTWYHGFCWVITRKTYNRMKDAEGNLLDERFKIGYFEDLDLWKRMMDMGMKLFKHNDIYVSHYGGMTVRKMENVSQFEKENEKKFIEKHNMPKWRDFFYPGHGLLED